MKKVLFVCLGNICRSAMAEGILNHKISNLSLNMMADSAGTSSYHIGQAPDRRMQAKAHEHGIDISGQRGRQFEVSDFDEYDYIFPMDSSNRDDILRMARDHDDAKKVDLFLNQSNPDNDLSVPDPYYGGEQGFEDVYQMLDVACDAFLSKLEHHE